MWEPLMWQNRSWMESQDLSLVLPLSRTASPPLPGPQLPHLWKERTRLEADGFPPAPTV